MTYHPNYRAAMEAKAQQERANQLIAAIGALVVVVLVALFLIFGAIHLVKGVYHSTQSLHDQGWDYGYGHAKSQGPNGGDPCSTPDGNMPAAGPQTGFAQMAEWANGCNDGAAKAFREMTPGG